MTNSFKKQLMRFCGDAIDGIRINTHERYQIQGRPFYFKQRRLGSGTVLRGANLFFRVAGNPVRALAETAGWQQWECDCFLLLHDPDFNAFIRGHGVCLQELPGQSLSSHLDAGTLSLQMFVAAGRELRRAHSLASTHYNGGWSHGDPHLGNFINDPFSGMARLMDFEVMHLQSLREEERHIDDLLVFLQDLAGRIAISRWLPSAFAFLEGYDHRILHAGLAKRLELPSGFGRLWWAVRTSYMPAAELNRRLVLLRKELEC